MAIEPISGYLGDGMTLPVIGSHVWLWRSDGWQGGEVERHCETIDGIRILVRLLTSERRQSLWTRAGVLVPPHWLVTERPADTRQTRPMGRFAQAMAALHVARPDRHVSEWGREATLDETAYVPVTRKASAILGTKPAR
jgi:hypothetical protein